MEKGYQKYLKGVLNEAGDNKTFTPVVRHAGIEGGDAPETTKKLKGGINSILSSMPNLNVDADIATDIVSDAIRNFEHDVKGRAVVPGREQGVAVGSQSFANANPVAKALYMLTTAQLNGKELDDAVKVKILKGLKYLISSFPTLDLKSLSELSVDDLAKGLAPQFDGDANAAGLRVQKINSTLAGAYNDIIHASKEASRDSNTTMSGLRGGRSTPRSNSELIKLLHKLDAEQFANNASTFGNNYQSVAKENEIVLDYLESKLPQGSTEKTVGKIVSNAKKDLFSKKDIFVSNADERVADVVNNEITAINDGIKDMEDGEEINAFVRDHIANIEAGKYNRAVQRLVGEYYGDFLKNVKVHTGDTGDKGYKRNQEIQKQIPPKAMKAIIDSLYEYNPDIISSNIHFAQFIERNYSDNDPQDVQGHFKEKCIAGGGCGAEEERGEEEIAATPMYAQTKTQPKHKGTVTAPTNLSDLMSRVKTVDTGKKDRGPVGDLRKKKNPEEVPPTDEIKKESFYDTMLNMINE
jgi:hypothetical protein